MKILSIDTSSANCSISICEATDDSFNTIISKNNSEEKTHSQKLMPLIAEMFEESGLDLNNIDLLVSCLGPGSFTGIRIGVATVKAFADSKNIPTTGVTSLESLCYNVENSGYIIPIINAKNNNAYSNLFFKDGNKISLILENHSDSINTILETFHDFLINQDNKNFEITFVGDGIIVFKDLINEFFHNFTIKFSQNNIQNSISLAKCGYYKYIKGIYGDSNFISPVYLRKSQAERNNND